MYKETIPYGLLSNKYVTVDEIPDTLPGISCGCICPQCKKPLELVNRQGTKYFRHKSNEIHCHFDMDYHSLEYIWKALEESGFLEEFGLTIEDLAFFKLNFNASDVESVSQDNNIEEKIRQDIKSNMRAFYEDRTFKLSIHDEEYYIKLGFHTTEIELQGQAIFIDIGEIIRSGDLFSLKKNDIVDRVQDKIKEVMSDLVKQNVKKQKAKKQNEIQQERKILDATKVLDKQKNKEIINKEELINKDKLSERQIIQKGEILKYYGKICPQCGGRMCSMKVRIGATVACENYPECDYGAGNYWF